MEVLSMAGKLLRNILTDKIENPDAEYYKQALDLSPGYSDCNNRDSHAHKGDWKTEQLPMWLKIRLTFLSTKYVYW